MLRTNILALWRVSRVRNILGQVRTYSAGSSGDGVFNTPDTVDQPQIPQYEDRTGESFAIRKARVIYQSRKRGMLENDLLLSSFASKYLDGFTESQLVMYDRLINKPRNEWDIFHWITGKDVVPEEFNNEIMQMLKEFAKNTENENRTRMPDLHHVEK